MNNMQEGIENIAKFLHGDKMSKEIYMDPLYKENFCFAVFSDRSLESIISEIEAERQKIFGHRKSCNIIADETRDKSSENITMILKCLAAIMISSADIYLSEKQDTKIILRSIL